MEFFDKYGWQIGSFLSVVGLMIYLVKTLLVHFFRRLEKTDDIIANCISTVPKFMEKVCNSLDNLNERTKEEHKEMMNNIRRIENV